MEDTQTQTTENNAAPKGEFRKPFGGRGGRSFDRGGRPGGRGGRRMGDKREKPEFDQKILSVRRVTRVVSGGRRFSFSVAILIGDRKGSVGLGLGKSADTTLAINKAVTSAKKNMLKIPTDKDMSIAHQVEGKFKSSRVMLMPNRGKGLVAGGALRDILLLAGLKNVTGKIFSRSKTHGNNAKAAIEALKMLKSRKSPLKMEKEPEMVK
jgi:small subunit ribosomal protein S5